MLWALNGGNAVFFLGVFFSISERLALAKPFPRNPTLLIIVVLMFYLEVESSDNLSDRQTLNLLVAYPAKWITEDKCIGVTSSHDL